MLLGNKRWKNGVRIEEVYGNFNNSQQADNILPIYHIHGYLPPFNEPFLSDGNEIVLSMEEYYDNVRNVYSWQTATQLHFLCHFTCMFVGISLSDINPAKDGALCQFYWQRGQDLFPSCLHKELFERDSGRGL